MIKNIIFDIGKVLFDYDPKSIVTTLIPDSNMTTFYVEKFHESEIWQNLDGGSISDKRAAENVAQQYPDNSKHGEITRNIHYIIENFHELLPPIKPMIQAFKLRLNTHRVFLLSNFQDRPFDRLCASYPFLKKAEGAIVSAKEKCMKTILNV